MSGVEVVVIGSSGGGAATLGHTDAKELLSTIHKQLQKVTTETTTTTTSADNNGNARTAEKGGHGHGIKFALFISLHGGKGMDSANPLKDRATLWTVGIGNEQEQEQEQKPAFQVQAYYTGLLKDVNTKAKQLEGSVIVPYLVKNNSTHKHQYQHQINIKSTSTSN